MTGKLKCLCGILAAFFFSPLLIHAQSPLKQGIESYTKGEIDKALVYFSEAIKQNPRDAAAYFNRGNCYAASNDYEKAIADWSEAIRLDPKDPEALSNRGNAYVEKGEYDKAIADADAAIKLNPKLAEAYSMRGVAYDEKGDHAKGIEDFSEAIQLAPGNVASLHNRGRAYAMRGDCAKALADFAELIKIDNKDAHAHNQIGWLLATCADPAMRDGKKALMHAKLACEFTEYKEPIMLQTLAAAYAESGDFAQAVEWQTKFNETPGLNERNVDEGKIRLDLYKVHLPYHQDPLPR